MNKTQLLIPAILLFALFARLTINLPWNEANIPITGQSFIILLVAFLLGSGTGTLAVLIYLMLGAVGLPVFADGAGGAAVFQEASAGFLVGFLPAAFLAGYLGDNGWRNSFLKCLLAMFLATALLMFCGVLWLSLKFGFTKALEYGFYPFVPGAVIKIVLSAVLAFVIYKFYLSKNC